MKLVKFLYDGLILGGTLSGDEIKVASGGTVRVLPLSLVKLVAPAQPSKVVSVGLNYRDHARELGMAVPAEPVIFIKPSTAVIGPGDVIMCPRSAGRLDYEAELGVVIKARARNVPAARAMDCILGYTCLNDITARDLQKKDIQWTRSKSFDTFAPIGPWIETELDPSKLQVRAYLNGELKQDSSTAEFVFPVPQLVSFISSIMTLLPGDIIATGTPPGVGPMEPGDEIIVEVEGIGRLVNRVGAEE